MVADILRYQVGVTSAISNQKISKILADRGFEISDSKIGSIIHQISIAGSIKRLIATENGYYVSKDYVELESYISSLQGRVNEINLGIDAIKRRSSELK